MACDLAVIVDDTYIRHVGPEHGSVPAGARPSGCRSSLATAAPARSSSSARKIPARRAEEWGLVNRAVPAAELGEGSIGRRGLARKLPQTTRYASST